MTEESVYLTRKGLEELKKELDYLTVVKRAEVAAAIQQAKEFGDLAENAEYENAKNQQAFVEGRIATLEKMISNATIIEDNHKGNETIINVGATVTIKNQLGKKQTFTIVGSAESDPIKNKISNSSPMGQALLGHQLKDKVKVPTPAGINEIEIVSVN
ncbi:transcription elongation factor GreA [Candidatus Wirthbacteria bacterium CG2_30_54_11]|uniref:Transcription elongation factor GreA n=1 Tax=Candidatus Wirthbacteria bacterium CG2_30_54_11 TaxID=1817892 RepID=A0A1J5IY55_9BACT|nr:MAG: transcription elongation factor GreA [Candidatus Wirthbacteria bacterium CG2_30_54_11]